MKAARQHIMDILDDPSRHQDHAKRWRITAFSVVEWSHDSRLVFYYWPFGNYPIVNPIQSISPYYSIYLSYRYAAAVVMTLAYGKYPKSYYDPIVLAVNRCLTRLGNNMRIAYWKVDTWPFLRYVALSCGFLEKIDLIVVLDMFQDIWRSCKTDTKKN